MPADVLTDTVSDPDDTRPVVGFFGKLPSTGDFVSRGLPDSFRRSWDAWLTGHVAPLQRDGLAFPADGLRFRLVSGRRLAAGLILPSQDSAGRLFPLSLLLIADGELTRKQIDNWCDAARALPLDTLAPDPLWHALDALPAAEPKAPATGRMQLWTAGQPALAVDPAEAGPALRKLLAR
jgi:type VI secretion system protein ImpM